jgi:hypothetical protein
MWLAMELVAEGGDDGLQEICVRAKGGDDGEL